ncbi:unnamed protein product, partial [Prorocentrum cordatum]
EFGSAMTSRAGRVPGRRLLVRFEGDTHSHERLLLWPTRKDIWFEGWVILTADDDLYIEWVKDWAWICDLTGGWPADLRGGVVRFRGAMTAGEVLARVLEGRDEAMKYRAKRGLPERLGGRFGEEPTTFLDWNGRELAVEDSVFGRVRRRLASKGVSSELRAAEASGDEAATRPALADAADESVEVVSSEGAALVPADGSAGSSDFGAGPGGVLGDCARAAAEVRAPNGMKLGDPVVGGRAVGLGSFRAPAQLENGGCVMCEKVPADAVESWRRSAIEAASEHCLPSPPPEGEPGAARGDGGRSGDLRAEFAAADAGAERARGAATPPAQEAEAEGDARTFCAERAAEGVIFKSRRKAVDESSQLTFEGCELRGASTCLHLCRRSVQHTGDPKMRLLTFCMERGISGGDRARHELTTLAQALWLAGTYDGLNSGGGAALESIARRLVTVVEAYRSGPAPGQASWESSRCLTGVVGPFDVASLELRLSPIGLPETRARQELEETGAALALGGLPGAKGDARGGPGGAVAKAKAKARAGAGAVEVAGGAGECFPVPEVQQFDPDIGFGLTRREKLQVRRLANDAIQSLSWMRGARWREAGRAQPRLATFDEVAGLRRDMQRRAQLAAAGWRRSSSATSSQQARANLASFVHDRLSIPEDVRRAPRVDRLLPDAALIFLKEYESYMLRSPVEVTVLDRTPGPARPWADPVLKSNRKVCVGLIKRLLRIGLARLSASKKCDVGAFVVKKKDCFHRLRFPKESKVDEYFACPEAWASELGLAWWKGRRVEKDMVLYPLAQSLPMGWAWSLYFAREANARQVELTEKLRGAHLPQDRGSPLALQGGGGDAGRGKYCYVDNSGVLADDEEYGRKGLTAVTETFGGQGLTVHETEVACECGVVLGIEVDGARGRTRPTAKRFWRVRDSIQEVLRRGVCSRQELEVLVGHATFVALIRRGPLSILHITYRFVKKLYYEKAPLWLCVTEELEAFCGVMVFLEAKWDDQWLPGVNQTDASPRGFGVAYSQWLVAAVADAGRVPERARFRSGAEAARSHAFAAAGLEERDDRLLQARAEPAKDEALRWERDRSMGSTTTNGLKTGIKTTSQTIKSMSETGERAKQNLEETESYHQKYTSVQRGAVGRSRTLAAAGERQARARSRSSRRARTLTAARATSLQSRLEAPTLEPSGSLEAEARLPARAADAGSTVGGDESDSASEEAVTEADRNEERLARQRARRRVARMAEGKTTMLPGQSYLEAASVSEASRVRYRSCVQELLDFADRESMALCEDGEVDECLVAWMNSSYRLGDRVWRGEYMAAALMLAFPNFGRAGAGARGFGVLLMVGAYPRPSELLSLRRGSLAPPARGGPADWSLHLFPREEIKRSKVGSADDTVVMNSERMRWADPVFAHMAKGSSAEKPFPWDYQQFGRLVRGAGDRLWIPVVPYQ